MSKTIQYKNPNINKKIGEKDVAATKNLSYSLVVSLHDQQNEILHFIDCLKKIKQDFYSKFEI